MIIAAVPSTSTTRSARWLVALLAFGVVGCAATPPAPGPDPTRLVRFKLSAGDLTSAIAAVEDYGATVGRDAKYLEAVGWLARGAWMLGRPELAERYVGELFHELPTEREGSIGPFGAAIEVESKILAAQKGESAALEYLGREASAARDTALRSRIWKNFNLLSLVGHAAPQIGNAEFVHAQAPTWEALKGSVVLLYFWDAGCGDCRAQSRVLGAVYEKYASRGLVLIAPTRYYGGAAQPPVPPADEKQQIERTWAEQFPGLGGVPVPIDTETMVRYGASATPTFVLVDRKGIVQMYSPTRIPQSELERQIERLL